jgi:hypothetical protein
MGGIGYYDARALTDDCKKKESNLPIPSSSLARYATEYITFSLSSFNDEFDNKRFFIIIILSLFLCRKIELNLTHIPCDGRFAFSSNLFF